MISKEEILEKICIASRLQNLGLFVGSGFSKALLTDSNLPAYSWSELLEKICEEYSINEDLFNKGSTYPLIASSIMERVQDIEKCSLEEANRRVKYSIVKLVNFIPSQNVIDEYNEYFKIINPSWIVTTNYDNILEEVIGATAYPILPGYLFYNTSFTLPVYHIHGSILDSQSIVITNEDYAKTMRPSDYRHIRLPILLKESTVLMVGYAIGDLNVISAIDYSKNVYSGFSNVEHSIIQLVYTSTPKEYCYEKEGIIIYEIDSLNTFFRELKDYIFRYKSVLGRITNKVNNKQEEFTSSTQEYIDKFDDNIDNYRLDTIDFIYSLESNYWYIYTSFISLLQRVFEKNIEGSKHAYQFQFYDFYLNILLDLIERVDVNKIPIIYLTYLIEKMDYIAPSIGDTPGQSYDAYATWKKRMNNIPSNFIDKIYLYFENVSSKYSLKYLLNMIRQVENK